METSDIKVPSNWLSYYLTGTGKIAGVKREELLEGDAQQRRELIGNSFSTPKEASHAKAKLEALNRLKPYTVREFKMDYNTPTIITKFKIPDREYHLLQGDIALLADYGPNTEVFDW
ncbi:MAG: hypothetical protein Q4A70_00390 [Candidatus Saccharibacteria bacterium]|nr:hypothetical protein [Candidatus Saccharibacteria bacterium]